MNFMTLCGAFWYMVLPFNLKHMGAKYQRAMVSIFYDLIPKTI